MNKPIEHCHVAPTTKEFLVQRYNFRRNHGHVLMKENSHVWSRTIELDVEGHRNREARVTSGRWVKNVLKFV